LQKKHGNTALYAGTYSILEKGIPSSQIHIRDALSALGWSKDREKIIFLVIEGHKNNGYSYNEAGKLMKLLGL